MSEYSRYVVIVSRWSDSDNASNRGKLSIVVGRSAIDTKVGRRRYITIVISISIGSIVHGFEEKIDKSMVPPPPVCPFSSFCLFLVFHVLRVRQRSEVQEKKTVAARRSPLSPPVSLARTLPFARCLSLFFLQAKDLWISIATKSKPLITPVGTPILISCLFF